jgi:hypothetical protein
VQITLLDRVKLYLQCRSEDSLILLIALTLVNNQAFKPINKSVFLFVISSLKISTLYSFMKLVRNFVILYYDILPFRNNECEMIDYSVTIGGAVWDQRNHFYTKRHANAFSKKAEFVIIHNESLVFL